jgi:hypothetical protein
MMTSFPSFSFSVFSIPCSPVTASDFYSKDESNIERDDGIVKDEEASSRPPSELTRIHQG